MSYSEEEYLRDKERILTALDAVAELQERFKDVIAIPEVISLHDVADYRLQTDHGVAPFHELFSRQSAAHVLHHFAQKTFITHEKFEDTIVSALNTTNVSKD